MRAVVVGLVVGATLGGVACGSEPPLSLGAIRNCMVIDTGIAVPVDTAVLNASRRRCLKAAGVLR